MHRKWWSAALVGAAFMVAGATVAPAQETLKIGGVGPLSGGGTAWGLAAQRGMEIAIDEINAAGGFKADGKTYKLELIMYDDQYTGAGGKAAAERLVNQDKVKFIIGPVGSPPALALISVTNPAKVLALTNGYAPQILKNDTKDPYNFRIYPTNLEFGPPLIKWLKENAPGGQEGRPARAQRRGRPVGRRRARRGLSQAGLRGRASSSSSAASRSSRR